MSSSFAMAEQPKANCAMTAAWLSGQACLRPEEEMYPSPTVPYRMKQYPNETVQMVRRSVE